MKSFLRIFLLVQVISIQAVFAQDVFNGIVVSCQPAGRVAPKVSAAYIVRVISQQGGYEDIEIGQEQTYKQHGPQGLKIITAVCGYGGTQRDTLNYAGSPITPTQQVDVDSNQDGIVDGFLILWDMNGKSIGATAIYNASSVNEGSQQKTVELNIR